MKQVLGQIAEHYNQSLKDHGEVAAGVGWGTAQKHAIRFEQLLQLVQGEASPFSVNDLGCGYGALIDELDWRGHTVTQFTGYDISEKMVAAAEARYGDRSGVSFRTSPNLESEADFSFASGIFNVRFAEDETAWQTHIIETLDNMNACSSRGFAFNLLTSYVDWTAPDLYYADPAFWLDHCLRHYSGKVALLHDTPLYEWTMIVRKP
jgi:SAM-dependent methyltransferase